jgi:hypothetical protein|tara:strand:+ start:3754 stop:4521 length:768 start_codon:yes stop_codon:yes gene_type:complete
MFYGIFALLNTADVWLAIYLPLWVRLVFYGLFAGIVAMWIYSTISNQDSIRLLKKMNRELRKKMLDPELEDFIEYRRLAWLNLKTALSLLGNVLVPVLLSVVPVIIISVWLDTFQGIAPLEKQESLPVAFVPNGFNIKISPPEMMLIKDDGSIELLVSSKSSHEISIYVNKQLIFYGNPFSPPVSTIGKKSWWNFLFFSSAGYLVEDSPLYEVRIGFQRKEIFSGLPGWASGWEVPFFFSMSIAVLLIKIIFRIH